jgi:hypothetical protein
LNAKLFFTDRPIAYHPILAKVFGSVTAALFLSQIGYWSDKGAHHSGWIWKTEEEMTEETGLSRSEQQTARALLTWTGVLEEKRKGVPARMWFKIDWDMLDIALTEYENERRAQQEADKPQPVVENQQQDAEIPQTIHRLQSEITSVVEKPTTPIVANGKDLPIDKPSPAEQAIEQTIFGLGWKERVEIREMAEKDVGLVSLTQALTEFKAKVFAGEYKANWGTLRKFWNNVMSTNALRAPAPAVIEMPEYQRNIKWAT